MKIYALDTESFYSKDVSIKEQGTWHYLRHPECEIYMVSVAGDDGFEWAGDPRECPWERISGDDAAWVSHNLSFDGAVVERLRETGVIPDACRPAAHWCSADLMAYLGFPRALANAVPAALPGTERPSKDVRDKMKGKRFETLSEEDKEELRRYALDDARWCLALWKAHSDKWPAEERELSAHTAGMPGRGIPVDREALEDAVRKLRDIQWQAEQDLPWADGTVPVLSPKALAAECRKAGIEPPSTLAMDSPELDRWETEHGDKFPWTAAMRDWRRANALRAKMETILSRVMPCGRASAQLLYFGASTGRFSGTGSVNWQNLNRGEFKGVNLRHMVRAPEGHVLVVSDYCQVEPRVLAYLCRDRKLLDKVRGGFGVYEAYAAASGLWSGEAGTLKKTDPKLYQFCKAAVLGLGYGAGAEKFAAFAPALTGGAYAPTLEEAERAVADYRRLNPKVTAFWREMDKGLRNSLRGDFTVTLPSGRDLVYRKVSTVGGLTAEVPKGGKPVRVKFFGQKVVENVTQAAARDVMADGLRRVLASGIEVLWHVHDEIIALCRADEADDTRRRMEAAMRQAPDWAPSLPLEVESTITTHYTK